MYRHLVRQGLSMEVFLGTVSIFRYCSLCIRFFLRPKARKRTVHDIANERKIFHLKDTKLLISNNYFALKIKKDLTPGDEKCYSANLTTITLRRYFDLPIFYEDAKNHCCVLRFKLCNRENKIS